MVIRSRRSQFVVQFFFYVSLYCLSSDLRLLSLKLRMIPLYNKAMHISLLSVWPLCNVAKVLFLMDNTLVWFWLVNAKLNNISAIPWRWRSVLLVKNVEIREDNHWQPLKNVYAYSSIEYSISQARNSPSDQDGPPNNTVMF